jgi:outer-membrane receptor for ferric coprogen and ferric-rhodotorulic acid
MKKIDTRHLVTSSVFAVAVMYSSATLAAEAAADDESNILVVARVGDEVSTSATGLDLTRRETPQSITIIDRTRIDNFAMTNAAQVLDQVVGVNVERGESDRTTFNARGFDITNFQVDGIGLPLISGIKYGEDDTFFFERIETIRGANGLMTGIGNPSATINYVRKRPLEDLSLHIAGYAGSYDYWRMEADASVPLTQDGGIAVRLMGAHEQRNSYLINYDLKRNIFAGIVSAKLAPELTATAGYTYQDNVSHGSGWGAVTFHYSDGTRIDLPRSSNFSPEWATWPTKDEQAFAELAYTPGNKWTIKGIFTYKQYNDAPEIAYIYGNPDPVTGLGLNAFVSQFTTRYKRYLGDFYATGPFNLFGREHRVTLGLSYARSDGFLTQALPNEVTIYPSFRDLDTIQPPRPTYGAPFVTTDETQTLKRAYIATQINLADFLKTVAGASYSTLKTDGRNFGLASVQKDSKLNPYIGVLVDPVKNVTVYASYTTIFSPQSVNDANFIRLAPVRGNNLEAGIKADWLDKRLYTSAAVFKTKQNGLGEYVGNVGGNNVYEPTNSRSKGFELEVAGAITDQWQISGGYTGLKIEDDAGDAARTYQPRKSFKFSSTYTVPQLNNFSFGGQLRWQSKTYDTVIGLLDTNGDPVLFSQKAYGVIDLMTGIDVIEGVRATFNLRNITNRKYLYSMVYASGDQGFFAPGRNFTVSLAAKF